MGNSLNHFALIVSDVIMNSKTPVYTINLGYQYSMGFLIGLAGHKRYAMPNAKFLLHDGSNFVFDSGAKAQDRMEFNKKMESRIKDYILSRSKLTTEEYDSKYRRILSIIKSHQCLSTPASVISNVVQNLVWT